MRSLCLVFLAGCTAIPVAEENSALGQPSGDYPNYDERVVLYATNRARVDPEKEGWGSYDPQPPLQWEERLNKSARAHSTDMRDTPCFQHDSCNGTDIWDRITSYYTSSYQYIGENISAGVPDGITAVHNWIYEIGAPPGETGHRENIFSPDFAFMGVGMAPGGSAYKNYWTQDFVGNPVTRPALSDGIHFPKTGKSITFGVTWYDAAGQAPSALAVVVDGACHDLTLARGDGGLAAYELPLTLADGCHPYYFRAASGTKVSRYPDNDSLQVGSTSGCALFANGQAPADCDVPIETPDLMRAPDLARASSSPDLALIGPAPQNPDPAPENPQTPPSMRAEAGCSLVAGPSAVPLVWMLLLVCLVVRRRQLR